MTVDEWLEKYKEIGKESGYSDREIQVYGGIIRFIKENIHEKL